jgi:deoxycytidylate deaminase/dephospho-CoA kinase
MSVKPWVIGLTGPFGSGCSLAAKYLEHERGFSLVKLSAALDEKWKELHPGGEVAPRSELQALGDDLRKEKGRQVLAEIGLGKVGPAAEKIVVDGIRNPGEVDWLRLEYGYRFTLIAVLAPPTVRWDRIGALSYNDQGLSQEDFAEDDRRDSKEDVSFGQQVTACIDHADILVDNSDIKQGEFKQKILDYADLALGLRSRPAQPWEILMNMAYSASHSSKCLKRHVGAVVVDTTGKVVGVGYNENPIGTKPCMEEPKYNFKCYRDIVRNEVLNEYSSRRIQCPVCGNPILRQEGPPWYCKSCSDAGNKTALDDLFFPDRAMNWCTAIHAEVWALFAAADRAKGGELYTTTFPCFQCAEKIKHNGIATVWYTEAYPDAFSRIRLELAGVKLKQFDGVRSSSFERIFAVNRPA